MGAESEIPGAVSLGGAGRGPATGQVAMARGREIGSALPPDLSEDTRLDVIFHGHMRGDLGENHAVTTDSSSMSSPRSGPSPPGDWGPQLTFPSSGFRLLLSKALLRIRGDVCGNSQRRSEYIGSRESFTQPGCASRITFFPL